MSLGICLVPFVGYIVGDVSYIKENIILLYLLFLLNSVISYFFVYKKSLIIACQKNYIVDIYQQIFYAFQVVAQILFLAITKQFIIDTKFQLERIRMGLFNILYRISRIVPGGGIYAKNYIFLRYSTTRKNRKIC